eukprot:TRINITY_DN14786_c0_g1_i1.p1 TRINITY_DN14786_c0_g1~~TRINITY_DN14786_c0_g1_i1.p1  ORF type:complete len:149 (+),score=34.98 TRINITY_DN14786_c0_g1_i1:63-449(+)
MSRYRNDGFGRDSYICESLRRPAKVGDLSQRRDTLPQNVYNYLKQQVHREEYEEYVSDIKTLGNKIKSGGGRRTVPRETATMREEAYLRGVEEKYIRQQRLKTLYEAEYEQWQAELDARGLAIARERE